MALKSSQRGTGNSGGVDVGAAPADLKGVVFTGVLWKSGTRVVAEGTRFVLVLILARLLTPTDYGVAGMALVATSFVGLFTDPALGAALIQRPTIDERDRSTVFWMAVGIGTLLTIVGVATSGAVASFFGEPQVQNLFIVTSLCFFITSLAVAHRALLTRQLAYRSLEIREMASIITGAAVAITFAVAGAGPWAIVSNFVAYSLMTTVLAWLLLDWRPRARFSLDSARSLSGFSTRVFAATLLSWGNQNLDNTLVGRFLGAPALGTYALAYNSMQTPRRLVAGTVNQAVNPVFSRIQSDKPRLERAFVRTRRLSVALVAPCLLGIIIVAPDVVPVAFGHQWHAAILPLQLLCLGGIAVSLNTLNWSVLQASGEARALLRLTLLESAITWSAFVAGLPWGIVGVSAFYAGARWLLVLPETWMSARATSFGFWACLRAGGDMLLIALVAAAIAFASRELLLDTGVSVVVRLALVAAVMTGAYAVLLSLVTPSLLREIWQVARFRSLRTPGAALQTSSNGESNAL